MLLIHICGCWSTYDRLTPGDRCLEFWKVLPGMERKKTTPGDLFFPRAITLVHTDPGSQDGALHSPRVPVDDGGTQSHEHLTFRSASSNLLDCLRVMDVFGWVQRVLRQLDTRLHRWYVYIYIYIRHVNCVPICCFSSIGDELNLTSVNYHAEVRWIIRAHLRPGPQKFNTDTKKWPLFISYPSLFSGGVVCSYFSIGLAL